MKYILLATITFLTACITLPMPEDTTGKDLGLNIKLASLNIIDDEIPAERNDELKYYKKTQNMSDKLSEMINSNITGSGPEYVVNVVLKESKVEITKDNLSSKEIKLISNVEVEFVSTKDKSNYISVSNLTNKIEAPKFKWKDLDKAYIRNLKKAVYNSLVEMKNRD